MKEETKKRLNKLITPLTTRALSIIGTATIMTTGLVGCKEDKKQHSEPSDVTASLSSTSSEDVTSDISSNFETSQEIISSTDSSQTENSTISSSSNSNETSSQNSSKPSSSQTPSKPSTSGNTSNSTTNSTPSTPEVNMPSKLTANNINDVEVIDSFASNPNRKIFSVDSEYLFTTLAYQYDGQRYYCDKPEYRLFITLLNQEYIYDETLISMFSNDTLENIERYSSVINCLITFSVERNATVNYDALIIDNNKKKFLKKLEQNSRNSDSLLSFVKQFYENNNDYFNYGDDIIIDYYVYRLVRSAGNFYNNSELENLSQEYSDSYFEYKEYLEHFYNKSRSKSLIK